MVISRKKARCLALLAGALQIAAFADGQVLLLAESYGLRGDGKTDDGPAIRRMLEAVREAGKPAVLRFPRERRIYVASGTEGYVFRLNRINHLTIDGNASTFLVDHEHRFLHATSCERLEVANLNVDVTPSPVVEATVIDFIDDSVFRVQADPEAHLGGPTGQDGEQAFFGMLWVDGKNAVESCHAFLKDVVADPKHAGEWMVRCSRPIQTAFVPRVREGDVRISLPVPGVAHCYGPSSMLRIDRCSDVTMRDVDVWSAPWFAFQIFRNSGTLKFQRVNIRPKPGSGRLTSSWRDGFHVKGNSGSLLFEECILEGMNDDAFNVSTHAWEVVERLASNSIRIRQIFPIEPMFPRQGGELFAVNPADNRRLAAARIEAVSGLPETDVVFVPEDEETDDSRVPDLELRLDRAVDGLMPGCVVWDRSVSNPEVLIRNCVIGNSCRFQSGVTLEGCETRAVLHFYSEELEGPFPSGSVIRNSTLNQGRGNLRNAAVFNGWRNDAPLQLPSANDFPLHNIRIENNTFHGGLMLNGVSGVELSNNRFRCGSLEVRSSAQIEGIDPEK